MKFLVPLCLLCTVAFAECVSFNKSFPYDFNIAKLKNAEDFRLAYAKNHFENVQPSEKPRIPKVIHHIWFGSELPEKFKKYVDSWKQHHPDWEHKLWTDKDIGSFPLITGNLINKAKNYGQKSDIFRIEVLYRFGGLYVDTDFLCLKPHDAVHHACDLYAGMFNEYVLTGIIGSCPHHPLLQSYLDAITQCRSFNALDKEQNVQKVFSVMKATGPYLFTNLVGNYLKKQNDGVIFFPNAYYYSFPGALRFNYWDNEDFSVVKCYIKKQTLAIHLWATSWHNIQFGRNRSNQKNHAKHLQIRSEQ